MFERRSSRISLTAVMISRPPAVKIRVAAVV
jgi:hypothetical protein